MGSDFIDAHATGIWTMPRISEFYGIVVEMYWSDHNPPHFHAKYGRASSRDRYPHTRRIERTFAGQGDGVGGGMGHAAPRRAS